MFRNYLAAAVRNLVRNRLYATINIIGLAIGMAAAIVTGLYIRDELGFDYFIPGHGKLYVVAANLPFPGRPDATFALSPPQAASWFKAEFGTPATGLCGTEAAPSLRSGDVEALQPVAWVHRDFFNLLPMPAIAGDPIQAVADPGGVVITRASANRFFGTDQPIGKTLEVNRTSTLTVKAVIEDLPATTNLPYQVFAAVSSEGAPRVCDPGLPYPNKGDRFLASTRTYVRIASPGVAAAINRAMPDFVDRNMGFNAESAAHGGMKSPPGLKLIPLDELHVTRLPEDQSLAAGSRPTLFALGAVAALALAIACMNFVNLVVARAGRRMVEIGVRKTSGAKRLHLVAQLMIEAILYAVLSLLCAVVITEEALPAVRAALDRPMAFAFGDDPALLGALLALTLATGALAGAYPALVQAKSSPATALAHRGAGGLGRGFGRRALVVVQFTILIALTLAALVVTRQTRFAMNEGLRLDKDAVMTMDIAPVDLRGDIRRAPPVTPRCRNAFVEEVRRLPGVRQAACSDVAALDMDPSDGRNCIYVHRADSTVPLACATVDLGFFELYALRPVAGRFFSEAGDDAEIPIENDGTPRGGRMPQVHAQRVVINEAAVHALGFAHAADAVGQPLPLEGSRGASMVVGVAPNFAMNLLHGDIRPRIYQLITPQLDTLSIKLAGRDIPETVASIDRLWKELGEPRAASHRFVDAYLEAAYATTLRQGLLIDMLCAIAISIGALGLFGLSAFAAERRTKEIGVRKALGAGKVEILRMLLWEFAKPVLLANFFAWPIAYAVLSRWLETFTYRIVLAPWMFLAASAGALLIAIATVAGHALLVARAEPASALRYE